MAIPVEVGDNVRVILKGLWDAKVETNNVFYFKVTDTTLDGASVATLQNLGRGVWNYIKDALLIVTTLTQTYTQLVVELLDEDANLVNGEIFFIVDDDGVGGQASESLPPADAWTFKYVRPDSSKRHGFKRFPGVPENSNTNGLPTSTVISSLDALATILGSNMTFYDSIADVDTEVGGAFFPQLVQRQLNGDVVSPANFYGIAGVVFDKIGHQDTRDLGRGV